MVAAPNTFMPGFDLEEVGHLKYGREIHFWNFEKKSVENTVYLGEDGFGPVGGPLSTTTQSQATASSAPRSRRM